MFFFINVIGLLLGFRNCLFDYGILDDYVFWVVYCELGIIWFIKLCGWICVVVIYY